MSKKSILWYFVSLLICFVLALVAIAILFLANDFPLARYFEQLPSMLRQLTTAPLFWILLSIPYLFGRLIRFWIRGYKSGGWKKLGKRFGFSFLLPVILIFLLARWSIWHQNSEQFDYQWNEEAYNTAGKSQQFHLTDQKIRGMHVFGGIDSARLIKLLPANIEHIILVPYAYQEDYNTADLSYGGGPNTRRDSVYTRFIDTSRSLGLEVIIKPHVWITNPSNGKWRADIEMENEEGWQLWEKRYLDFILYCAELSERHQLPHFCIGNEFYLSTTRRPEYWKSLIDTVRTVYSGKLTYGANWDREFREIEFWDKLDYIGIQAYFPLADKNYPAPEKVIDGWDQHLTEIESLSKTYDRKVIFTELGYKSTPDAARYPWGWNDFSENIFQRISTQTQTYCYQAFFKKVWMQDWMAGVMIWQWQTGDGDNDGNHNFTPEGKPAFNELAKGFTLDQKK